MIDQNLIDVVLDDFSGYPDELAAEDTRDAMMAAAEEGGATVNTTFPEHLWIEPKDWPEAAAKAKETRTRPIDYVDRYTNQGGGNGGYSTHECTSHAFRTVFEGARNRQRQIALGPPVPKQRLHISSTSASVWFSCLSVYAEANPNQWGGANVRQILRIASSRGVLPDKMQPRPWPFRHSLHGTCGAGGINQSRGPWVPVSKFPDGWRETAQLFRPLEFVFPETWQETVCLVLHGYAVGVGRNGHSIPYCEWMPDQQLMAYPDSYDILRYDSIANIRRTVGGSYAIITTTIPDDWEHPEA